MAAIGLCVCALGRLKKNPKKKQKQDDVDSINHFLLFRVLLMDVLLRFKGASRANKVQAVSHPISSRKWKRLKDILFIFQEREEEEEKKPNEPIVS